MGDKKRKFLLGLAVAGTTLGIMTGTAKDAKHEDNKRNTIKKEESHKISKNVITDAKTQVKNGPEVYSLEGRTPEGLAIYRNVWKEIEPLYNELKKEQKIFEDSRLYNSMSKEEKARLQLEKKQNISKLIKKEIAMAVERTGKKCSTQDIELFYNEEYGAGFILKINNTHKIYSYNLDGLQHIGIGISDLIKSIFEDWDEIPNNNELNRMVRMVYNMRYITTTAKNQYITYIDNQFLSTYVSVPYKEYISNKLEEYKEELEYLQNIFEYGEIYNQLSEHEIELNKSVVDDYIRLHICTEWASIITEKTGKECAPKDVMLSFDNNGVAILSWHNKILNIDSFRILDKPEGIPEELYRQTEACRKLRCSTTNNSEELRMLAVKAIQTTLDSKLLDSDVVNDEKIKNFIQPSEATQDNNVDKGRE